MNDLVKHSPMVEEALDSSAFISLKDVDASSGIENLASTVSNHLQDAYQRRFTYLRLSITDVCNFRCNYCLPDGYCGDDSADSQMSLPEITALVKAFAKSGTKKIRITGGEPTLRKDLSAIIKACKQTAGIETVALTTNAYRLKKDLDSYLDAGLDDLNVSLDSLQPETFNLITGHNKLQQILQSIDMAIERGVRKVKINAVLLKQYNHSEMQQFFNYIKHRPVTIRFIELMQTGDNKKFFAEQHVSGKEIQNMLESSGWSLIKANQHAGPAVEYSHPDYQGSIGLIMPYSKNFCQSCNRMRVSSSGNMHLCLFAQENTPLKSHLLSDTTEQLVTRMQLAVSGKTAGHQLQQGFSGMTKHLAMLGG